MTDSKVEQLREAASAVRQRAGDGAPRVGLVLGSGLGAFAEELAGATTVPYAEIPHMPSPGVSGHAGNLYIGELGGVRVACLQGRVHAYEGHPMDRVVFGVRLLAELGVRAALLTNAAGGIGPGLAAGDLMLITDHINLTGNNPLIGPNVDDWGPRFPDMTHAYDVRLCEAARIASKDVSVRLAEGVYAAVSGPSYETPAEVRMLQRIGANAVGMSTAVEVLALRHRGVRCGAMSCITNLAAGVGAAPLDHAEVEQIAAVTRGRFAKLLTRWVERAAEVL